MKACRYLLPLLLTLSVGAGPVVATSVYQEPEAFLEETFDGNVPDSNTVWFTGDRKAAATAILGHAPDSLRTRYWRHDDRTAWILEEIGKERPITVGLVVQDNQIERIKVLIFRESRGWEVRYPFFTDQFRGANLNEGQKLDRPIDNISGATLSVNALKRLARLALYLHRDVTTGHGAQ